MVAGRTGDQATRGTPRRSNKMPNRMAKIKHAVIKTTDQCTPPILKHPGSFRGRKKTAVVRFTTDDYTWKCWQCLSAFAGHNELSDHIATCSTRNAAEDDVTLPSGDNLSGCPFCPRDGCQGAQKPYYFHDFNSHLAKIHPEVKTLSCPYCTESLESQTLEDLTRHIILEHEIFWRPCPASLVCQRLDDVGHRVVTCLGCGWRTFVLRAHNAVQPPASLASHMSYCAGRGGRLAPITPLPPTLRRPSQNPSKTLMSQLMIESISSADAFAARFPTVRGFATSRRWGIGVDSSDHSSGTHKRLKYQSPLRTASLPRIAPISSSTIKQESEVNHEVDDNKQDEDWRVEKHSFMPKKRIKREPSSENLPSNDNAHRSAKLTNGKAPLKSLKMEIVPPKPLTTAPKPKAPKTKTDVASSTATNPPSEKLQPSTQFNQFVPKGVFDVSLSLPPPPPVAAVAVATRSDCGQSTPGSRKAIPGKIYVCPICGDSAILSSLRERDEHLQRVHKGELVFPCQLCGMAYPLYIALRRHAVLKHDSNFDAVLYGLDPEADPVECPYCELVAFTSPTVLQLHLAKIHPDQVQQQAVVAAVAAAALGSDNDDDDKTDQDWTENGKPLHPPPSVGGVASLVSSITFATAAEKRASKVSKKAAMAAAAAYAAGDLSIDPSDLDLHDTPKPARTRGRGRGRGGSSRGSRGGRGRGRGRGGRSAAALSVDPQLTHHHLHAAASTILMDSQGQPVMLQGQQSDLEVVQVPPNAVGPLEVALSQLPPDHAPATCRLCGPMVQLVLDNARELCIHMELDHNPDSATACEQLGCQACGRIFFGPHHRTDLIGHFRVAHQLVGDCLLPCPNHEPIQLLATSGADDQLDLVGGGCLAKFTSERLRDSHLMTPLVAEHQQRPTWSCPLSLEEETLQAMAAAAAATKPSGDGEDQAAQPPFDIMVLATEIAADAAGQMVLAYGCPLCSRVFTGDNCTARHLAHQTQCNAMTTAAAVTTTTTVNKDGTMMVIDPSAVTIVPVATENPHTGEALMMMSVPQLPH